MQSYNHKAEMIVVANHEATKCTLKRLGNMRDDLERIFQEQSRHCMHHYHRPDSPGWFCNQRNSGSVDGKYGCKYADCPYVNREAL